MQPDYIYEVPGIEVQGDYDKIIGPNSYAGTHKKILSVAQRMAEASENAGSNLEANSRSLLRKHQTTKREMTHRH